eukprot:TRINITY_DN12756_c1_g1_i2.p1 TRINITY_DN12756_c1_g1~~TRINITY_DN12756_c1_g1_i2.p1  ORF type:complete len:192 (-),score=43.10 TRINITY_DN12756_c1_g1_i2:150-725(-)
MLAEWLMGPGRELVNGEVCVELGAALGLPSLAASIAGASRCVATDLDPSGGKAMARSVARNRRALSQPELFKNVEWRKLDWYKAEEGLGDELCGKVSRVICADAIYEARAASVLASAANVALREGGRIVFASRLGRRGLNEFLDFAQAPPPSGCGLVLLSEEPLRSNLQGIGLEEGEEHCIWHLQKPFKPS